MSRTADLWIGRLLLALTFVFLSGILAGAS